MIGMPQILKTIVKLVLFSVSILLTSCSESQLPDGTKKITDLVDHHAHFLSPELIADWQKIGVTFSRPNAFYSQTETIFEVTPDLDAVVAVPMGQLYGAEWFQQELGLDMDEAISAISRENKYIKQLALHNNIFSLCVTIPARPYSMRLLRQCYEQIGADGIKLHFGAARIDFRDPDTIANLREIFQYCASNNLPVLLHLDNQRRGTDIPDIEYFLQAVFTDIPEAKIIIAHLGGSGNYDAWPRRVHKAIQDWLISEEQAGRPRLDFYLDISAVLLAKQSEGIGPTTSDDALALAEDLRAYGFSRIILGSDWPVFSPMSTLDELQKRAGLEENELARIKANSREALLLYRP